MRWVELVTLNVYGDWMCVFSILPSILAVLYVGEFIQLTSGLMGDSAL